MDEVKVRDDRMRRGATPRSALVRRPTFVVSAMIILGWTIVAVGWRWWGIDPFGDTGVILSPPSSAHWFGTDRVGRDVLARVLAGSEHALLVAPVGCLIATTLGTLWGLLAGFHRGWIDHVLMRSFDIFLALPASILLLLVAGAFGGSPIALSVAIGILFAPGIARIIRAEVLVEMGKDYVTTAKLQGERTGRIMVGELLPNVWPQVLVQATLTMGAAVFIFASLSFLGLAAEPPSPDWGLSVNENRAYLQSAWWTVVFPAAAIASLIVSVSLVGDNLKEVFRR